MSARAQDIVSDVIVELSQVPGVATQIYSAPRILQYVQDAFLLEIEEAWWPLYMADFTAALDGTTGRLTADLVGSINAITDYTDIQAVWPEGYNQRLRTMPPLHNPSVLVGAVSGGFPTYMMPDMQFEKRPVRIWPYSSSGNVLIRARQRNKIPIANADMIYLDRLLLTYDAAWMYCTDDGTVPGQVDKFSRLATKRRIQMKAALNTQPIQLDPRIPSAIDQSDNLTFVYGDMILNTGTLS